MGAGIAQVAASAHHDVTVFYSSPDAILKAKSGINNSLRKIVEKGKLESDAAATIFSGIHFVADPGRLSHCTLVVEAVVEDLSVKQKVFADMEKVVPPESILATNTSSLSITSIAASLKHKTRFIGLHFFNPAPVLPLVEIIPGYQTSDETVAASKIIIEAWGKIAVVCKDTPGFIVNRVARPFYGEALRIAEEGIADIPTIDWAMKEIGRFRMGPFELMDLIGIDVNYAVTETIFKALYYDPRYKPSLIQKRMVEANALGRKTGKGFYDYHDDARNAPPDKNEKVAKKIFLRILSMIVNEASELVFRTASMEDIDLAVTKGVNYPKGVFRWADEIGIGRIVAELQSLYEEYHEDRYRISPLLKKMLRENKKFYHT